MTAKHSMVAAIVLLALSNGYANKRSFTTAPPPTTQPDFCSSNPCVHGHCQPHPYLNTYVCKCIHGATGRNCEKEVDICLYNPCVSGTCSGHGVNFSCSCNKGYTGKLCDKEIDMCLLNPCVFGSCSGYGINFICTCDRGYTGKLCDTQIDMCLSNPCVFGTCSGNGQQFTCLCENGWIGKICDAKVPVNGEWTFWSSWTTCSVSCGTGRALRARTCTNPPPSYNGTQCSGPASGIKNCVSSPCPVDGGWTLWTQWNTCSLTCGSGIKKRTRSCSNPTPRYHGSWCFGTASDVLTCNTNPCIAKCNVTLIEELMKNHIMALHSDADICHRQHACSEALLLKACILPNHNKTEWRPDLRVIDHCGHLTRGEPIAEFQNGHYWSGNVFAVFWSCKGSDFELVIQSNYGHFPILTTGNTMPFRREMFYTLK